MLVIAMTDPRISEQGRQTLASIPLIIEIIGLIKSSILGLLPLN